MDHPVGIFWYGLFSGGAGVSIFFEISGFLITTLLLEEHRKRGTISLRGFYLRRVFRILPPLYFYISVIALLGFAGRLAFSWSDILSALFFVHNLYAPGAMWPFEHLWSICVEEQFYIVWPFVLVWCLHRKKSSVYTAAVFPLFIICASPLCRLVFLQFRGGMLHYLAVVLFRFDFIMYGCLVALLQHTPKFETFYRVSTRIWWAPPAVMLACNFISARYQNYFDLSVGYTINGFAIAMFLLWCTRNADSVLGKILNFGAIAWVGVLSYSIYIWQTLWLRSGNEAVFAPFGNIGHLPQSWLGMMLCATGSFYLLEKPSLRLRGIVIRWLHVYRQRAVSFGSQ